MEYTGDIFGGIIIFAGLSLYLWRNKRIFNRTNAYGVEQFPSYSGKLTARLGDISLWLISVLSMTFGLAVIVQAHESTWGGVVYAVFFGWLFMYPFFCKSK
jgi:hypothetical protein